MAKQPNDGGVFDADHARRKQQGKWKQADARLVSAITHIVKPTETIVDLGAGTGRYVQALLVVGYRAIGVDGIEGVYELSNRTVVRGDLTKRLAIRADWVISFEVGEHIAPPGDDAYLDNVAGCCAAGAIVSWAVPGQRGRGHVNCQEPERVASRLRHRGMVLDEEATQTAREIAGDGWAKKLLVLRHQR